MPRKPHGDPARMPFGIYKGKLLTDLGTNYIDHVLTRRGYDALKLNPLLRKRLEEELKRRGAL